MQLYLPHACTQGACLRLSHQPAGQPLPPVLRRHIQSHQIRPPLGPDSLNVRDHKPDNLTANLLRNANNGVPFLSKLPQRLSIETKLLRKTNLIQPKHRIKVSRPVVTKEDLATHSVGPIPTHT